MRRARKVLFALLAGCIFIIAVNLHSAKYVSKSNTNKIVKFSKSVRKLDEQNTAGSNFTNSHCSTCRNLSDFQRIKLNKFPVKKLLIFTNKRSGSSYVGELFNRNKHVFYMFEPLFPFTRKCSLIVTKRLTTLSNCLSCELGRLEEEYVEAFSITQHSVSDCIECGICFYNRHHSIHQKYYIFAGQDKPGRYISKFKCPYSLNMTVVSTICKNSTLSVYKILRVCFLEQLEAMYPSLFYQNPDMFQRFGILHLIRDPRAIISSRLLIERDEAREKPLAHFAKEMCDRMEENILYADRTWKDGSSDIREMKGVRFMRVRFEDIISSPPQVSAGAIYRYFGHELPMEVKVWMHEAAKPPDKRMAEDQFATQRESSQVLNGWRNQLDMGQVEVIQTHCRNMMRLMGYREVKTEKELRDLSNKLW